jgi:hypothetical protein
MDECQVCPKKLELGMGDWNIGMMKKVVVMV